MSNVRVIATLAGAIALRQRAAGPQVVVLHGDGRLVAVDVTTGQVDPLGQAPGRARSFGLDAADSSALVAGGRLGLWRVPLDGTPPDRLAGRLANPTAVQVDDARARVLVAEGRPDGRLLAFATAPLGVAVVGRGLRRCRGLTLEDATGHAYVAEAVDGGRVSRVDGAPLPTPVAAGLGTPIDLTWSDATQRRLAVADAAAGRVVEIDLDRPAEPPRVLFEGLGDLRAARPVGPDTWVLLAGDDLLLGELTARPPVELHVPAEPLFVAGWVRVPVTVNDPAVRFDDLEFVVEPPESAAMVSASRDESFDHGKPDVVLTAGWLTGRHELVALHRPTGTELRRVPFEITDSWSDPTRGPSLSVLGAVEAGPSGGTWGGGDFTRPQNSQVVPALGRRRVAVVLVDTADARYPAGAGLAAVVGGLRDELVDGVTVDGQTRSVADYFDQASNGLFGIDLVDIVGPVTLPGGWGTYFTGTDKDDDDDGVTDWVQWRPVESFAATVVAEIVQRNGGDVTSPAFLDLRTVDSIVIVVRSVPATMTAQARFVWPRANLGPRTHLIGFRPGAFPLPQFRGIAAVYMPDDWATQPRSGRLFHETLAHELGHNLELNDQYFQAAAHDPALRPRIASANPRSWELMAWEEGLPLPSAAHRLMLGWVDEARVKLFNFGVFGNVDETFTLHAAGAGPAPAGRFAAAEIRITDGRNYYVEYRPEVAGRGVDTDPPAALTVFGSDVTSRGATPMDRPEILRLRDDSDADRAEFQAGDDYEEVDTTSPQFPNDFILDVVATTADSATVRVRYGLDQEPDPALTPWSPSTNWQSPDIEVSNARSLADPAFRNVPWEGHDNTVVARVTNRGKIPAPGVRVRFAAKDFTFGEGAEAPLGEQVADVGTGATVAFQTPTPWRPPQISLPSPFGPIRYRRHSCLVARIEPYVAGAVVEVTPDNNEAQSNYTWMASTTASPSTRDVTVIQAVNPFAVTAEVSFEVHQPHPLFRTYISNRWLTLAPGESAPVLVMVESLFGDDRFREVVDQHHDERRVLTRLRLTALGDTGEACAPTVIGGASIVAIAGRTTRFDHFETDGGLATGVVVSEDTGEGVNGTVLVSARYRDPDRPELVRESQVQDGEFRCGIEAGGDAVIQAHYLGTREWGPCDSEPVEID